MKVRSIRLVHFRNIGEIRVDPESHLNFLIGSNGQGKTSVLEALSFLSTLRSFRGAKSDEVIRHGDQWSEIACTLSEGDWKTELKVTFSKQGERATKTAFIDGKAFRSSASFLSSRFGQVELGFHSIVFNPSDHDLVRGEPAGRRQYLDRVLSAENPEYLKNLARYLKVLEQRNALLRQDERITPEMLAGFTEPLVDAGAQITLSRLEWLQRLKEVLNDTAHKISPTQPDLDVFYSSSWVPEISGISIGNKKLDSGHFTGQSPSVSLDFLKTCFWKKLKSLEEAEFKSGSTLVGPHRDDWTLILGNQPLKGFGSQGEVRSALIALKLSEIELFRKRTGHRPILLLDDFSSELDRDRREFLLSYLSETDLQVFVTSTEEPPFSPEKGGKLFRVQEGRIL